MTRSFPENPYERIFSESDRPEIFRPGGFELTRRALDFCAFPERSALLDLGCGTGATVALMRHEYRLEASGVDPLAGRIRAAGEDSPARFVHPGTGTEVPFPDDRFAGLFIECGLSVMGNADRVLAEANRVLVPEGLLVVSDLYLREGDRGDVNQAEGSEPAAGTKPDAENGLRRGTGFPPGTCLGGAHPKERFLEYIAAAGFSPLLWEDHTELLHRFLAEQIMKRGSFRAVIELLVPGIRGGACDPAPGDSGAPAVPGKVKFGYFLFIGRKEKRWNNCGIG